jgi:hypothetical protein
LIFWFFCIKAKEQRKKLRSKADLSTSAAQGQQMPRQARHDGIVMRRMRVGANGIICVYLQEITANIMLQTQILKDQQGAPTGVFIPIKVWESVKFQYPDIESVDIDLPQWEKEFIDRRLEMIKYHPERLQPIETLFEGL